MSCLFFITPADPERRTIRGPRKKEPSRKQTIFTWSLATLWLILFSFGAISLLNPKWLQELSRPGIETESRNYKNFGDNFFHQSNYWRAITHYQKALEINPDFVGARVNLAITYSRVGDNARAERILKDALRAETVQKGVIYYNLGELYEKQGKTDEAIRYYRKAFGYEFAPGVIYRKLGTLYLDVKRYEKAREAFEMTLADQTDVTSSYQDMLRRVIATLKDDTTNLPIITERLARDIRPGDLASYDLEICRRVQERNPEIAKTHNQVGFVCVQLGDTAQAIDHFQKSLQIWPGNIDAKNNLQLLYELMEKRQVPTLRE